MILELPFSNVGAQEFIVQLGDRKFRMVAYLNERSGVWVLDMYDAGASLPIVANLPLVIGADLLAPFNLGIGSIFVNNEDASGLDAGPDDLGGRVKVYWFSPDEVAT